MILGIIFLFIGMSVTSSTIPNAMKQYNSTTGQILYVESDTLAIGANTYSVTATDANGCMTTDAMDIIVIDCAGIEENGMNLQVYPNPVKDILKLDNTSTTEITSIKLDDVLGRLVLELNNNFNQLDLSQLNSGLLFVIIETDEGILIKKIIKEKNIINSIKKFMILLSETLISSTGYLI